MIRSSETDGLINSQTGQVEAHNYQIARLRCHNSSLFDSQCTDSQLSDPKIRTYKLTDFQLAGMLVRSLESLCFLHL